MTPDTVADIHQSVARPLHWVDELNWSLHLAIADKLRRRPQLLGVALENLRAWKPAADTATREVFRRWKLILLSCPPEEIADFLADRSKEAARLRRDSPFCGILTLEEQRLALLRAFDGNVGNSWPMAA
jgi:hypothetical protein